MLHHIMANIYANELMYVFISLTHKKPRFKTKMKRTWRTTLAMLDTMPIHTNCHTIPWPHRTQTV